MNIDVLCWLSRVWNRQQAASDVVRCPFWGRHGIRCQWIFCKLFCLARGRRGIGAASGSRGEVRRPSGYAGLSGFGCMSAWALPLVLAPLSARGPAARPAKRHRSPLGPSAAVWAWPIHSTTLLDVDHRACRGSSEGNPGRPRRQHGTVGSVAGGQ